MNTKDPLAGIPRTGTSVPRPQITVDIGKPENCQYPVETPADFNYRRIQDENRFRRTGTRS